MKLGNISIFLGFLFVLGCAGSQQATVQEKPPGFIGRLFDNTVSRYNAFYNSNLVYETSISAAKDGFQENYDSLFAPSVQDAVARGGSVGGQMDEIIEKTTAMIEKKPYSKWVDDHFLLNGIAHYIKGDYDMAERIFRYVSSEYKNGVQEDRVSSRQKVKGVERAKQQREEAKKKVKAAEEAREQKAKEYEDARKEREREAKLRAKRAKNVKKRNKRLKKAAEREAAERKKAGLDVDAKEIVRDIKSADRKVEKEKSKVSKEDRELLAKAPLAKIDESKQKEGLLAHEFAAKDAMLWLAKTYITTENFIAANAVLTAINEDEYFPQRLNTDYYLTYADMHIRLENKPKAIEYVQLAADSARKNEKGRLYYLMGQMYADLGQWEKAEEAFNTVEKYNPYYDMIYHAKMNNIERALEVGRFKTEDFITPLKRMTRDAKNDDFLDEVYYYLGEAYKAKDNKEDALKAFNQSVEYLGDNRKVSKRTYLALAKQYYMDKNFEQAQPNYEEALGFLDKKSPEFATTEVYSKKLEQVNESLKEIHLQDSLLALGQLPDEDLLKYIEKKVNQEIRDQFKAKLQEANKEFGNGSQNTRNNNRRNRNNTQPAEGFYFYDLQQSVAGYSEFRQKWGDRPNVDNWRLSSTVNRMQNRASANQKDAFEVEEISSKEEKIAEYLADIPKTDAAILDSNNSIYESYLTLIDVFTNSFGDLEMAQHYKEELLKRNSSPYIVEKLNEIKANTVEPDSTENEIERPRAASEVEKLYELAYENYMAGNYEKAIKNAVQSLSFNNNELADKFAFILAMSNGQLKGEGVWKSELENFVRNHPNSPLKQRAQELINQF